MNNQAQSGGRPAESPGRIGDYELQSVIGSGGMATVYLARDPRGKEVAVKVMLPHLLSDPQFVQRFIQEAKATVSLRHENIVEVVRYGEERGNYYIASELVDGGTVATLLATMGKIPAPLAAEIFAQLLAGIGYAHSRGLVHRDLKPANLLVSRTGKLKIADFGIARTVGGAALTQTGQSVGTPAYMSPEQASGKPLDHRSDLFASGIILYELLSGANPYQAQDAGTCITRLLQGTVAPIQEAEPSLPPELEGVVERLLERDPALRFPDAAQALAAFAPYLAAQRERYPMLLLAALGNPEGIRLQLLKDQAQDCVAEAERRLSLGPGERRAAALILYRATLLDPTNPTGQELLSRLASEEKLRFGPSSNPKLLELETLLEKNPASAGVLQQMAQLYKLEGNLPQAVSCLKRYLKLRPKDGYVAGQLAQLVGSGAGTVTRPSAAASPPAPGALRGPSTAELMADIRTGGLKVHSLSAATPPGTGQVGAPAPLARSSLDELTEMDEPSAARLLWNAYGRKLLLAAVVVGLIALLVQRLGRFIERTSEESAKQTIAFAEQMDGERDRELRETAERQAQAFEKARQDLRAEADRPRAALEQATALARRGDHAGAIARCEELIAAHPSSEEAAEAKLLRAKSLLARGMAAEARAALGELLVEQSNWARRDEALLRHGEAASRLGEHGVAVDSFGQLLTDHPYSPFAQEATLLRGEAHAAQGQREDAAADFRQVLSSSGPSSRLHQRALKGLGGLGME